MKLTISAKGVLPFTAHGLKDEYFQRIKNHVAWFCKDRKVEKCKFKLEGEAEIKKVLVLEASLF